jgi:hypothetical protein
MNIALIREALNEASEYIMEVSRYDSGVVNELLEKLSSAFDETFDKE